MHERAEIPRAPVALAMASLLLFTLSAFSSLFVAYAWGVALEKFFAILVGIVAILCVALVGRFYHRWVVPVALAFVVLILASNLTLVWLQSQTLESLVAQLTGPLVILLPLTGGGIASLQRRDFFSRGFLIEGIGALVLLLIAFVLIGSGDISSGLALLTGTTYAAWLLAQARLSPRWQRQIALTNRLLLTAAVIVVVAYVWAIASPSILDTVSAWTPGLVPVRSHRYHDFLAIVADYSFTGSGLGVSEMVYSSYLFIVQVPFLAQAHNLYIQLAVEQGVPGLIGFVGLLSASLWALQHTLSAAYTQGESEPNAYLMATTIVGSLLALIVNGMLDADIYSGQLVSLIFVPIATAWGLFFATSTRSATQYSAQYEGDGWRSRSRVWSGAIAFIPFLLVAFMFVTPGGIAAAYANAGAVAQTKAELSIYEWPTWPMQDQVRRTNPELLTPAMRFYNAAISLNPYNVTAHWRLGQIALAQGDYAIAEQHLAQAYALAPEHRAVRQLLGEIYAVQGKVEQAIQLWQPLDVGQNQLQLRQWWYEMIGDSNRAFNLQETVRIYEHTACCP
jgi:hypothetical protein